MLGPTKPDRFFETTRGRIVALLRRADRTADELARELGLTDNAVRAHLATLERDGLVRPDRVRHEGRAGKPATVYGISPAVEPLFSKAYLPLLTGLLTTLAARLSEEELISLLGEVGRRLAASAGTPSGDLPDRVQAASKLLNELGGVTTVEEIEDRARYVIRARGCPVGLAVAARPEVCQAVVALLTQAAGVQVRSCCAHGSRPSCCFEATATE